MNIQISENFKKKTQKAILAIVVFVIVYLILLVLGLAFAAVSIYAGIQLITVRINLYLIIASVGIAAMGVFVFVFLVKFLFKEYKEDLSHFVEVTKEQEPQLFAFLSDIVKEVGTSFPKKVYISSEVNASVFYDSSFWSMFLPIPKNLHIGMGLVNTVTKQEFKAILAHEFGHFSQKSMAVGSYVYNVNKIIYNLLHDNEEFDNTLNQLKDSHVVIMIFMMLANAIIEGVKLILNQMYKLVNVSYMDLSREMEFHADEVGANIAGSKALETALVRFDLAHFAYQEVLEFYGNKVEENVKSKNIFEEMRVVMFAQAFENQIPIENNLPAVSLNDLNKYNHSKLNIKDQWASHPTTEDRVAALRKLNLIAPENAVESALTLFTQPTINESVTDFLFSKVPYKQTPQSIDKDAFTAQYEGNLQKVTLPKGFNHYYKNKKFYRFDVENIEPLASDTTFDTLFSIEKVQQNNRLYSLEQDKDLLRAIFLGEYKVTTFDYDGKKYKAQDANILSDSIAVDIEILKNEIAEHDRKIYQFYYHKAKQKGLENELKNQYLALFETDKWVQQSWDLHVQMRDATQFMTQETPIDQIHRLLQNVKSKEEKFKAEISKLIKLDFTKEMLNQEVITYLEKYVEKEWVYFEGKKYDNHALEYLWVALDNFYYIASIQPFAQTRALLNFQLSL